MAGATCLHMSARCQFPVACRLQAGVLPQLVHAPTAQSLLCRWGLSMDVRGYSGAFGGDCAPSFSCVLYNMGSRHAWKSEYHARSCSRASSTACAVPAALVGTQSPRPCRKMIICATKGACLEAHLLGQYRSAIGNKYTQLACTLHRGDRHLLAQQPEPHSRTVCVTMPSMLLECLHLSGSLQFNVCAAVSWGRRPVHLCRR
jgi:hypothetical protein